MNVIDKAWDILKKVAPDLNLDSFVQKLQPIFEQSQDLSNAEIKARMLESIKKDKLFGEEIAQGAEYVLSNQPSEEESTEAVQSYPLEGEESEADTPNQSWKQGTPSSKSQKDTRQRPQQSL